MGDVFCDYLSGLCALFQENAPIVQGVHQFLTLKDTSPLFFALILISTCVAITFSAKLAFKAFSPENTLIVAFGLLIPITLLAFAQNPTQMTHLMMVQIVVIGLCATVSGESSQSHTAFFATFALTIISFILLMSRESSQALTEIGVELILGMVAICFVKVTRYNPILILMLLGFVIIVIVARNQTGIGFAEEMVELIVP